ncbi:MAG TPA: CapA family protein [Spirochaetota bacterium]|nr:CapA family protein [Spirochaetota bacterium]HOL56689.1 CapA family protein [Spirochaetota bacterium]HPP04564.1 CapA family protein [Spirochaetota bacterium]
MRDICIIILFFTLINLNSQHIKISAIGDIMAHDTLQYYALSTENKYLTLFESTKPIFLSDDLTIGNLETPICDKKPISNYPLFNANSNLATSIKLAGIELLSTANNHSFDQGYEGVATTIEALKRENVLFNGTSINSEEPKPLIFLCNGVTIGYFAATFSLNGLSYKEIKNNPSVNYYSDSQKDIESLCKIVEEYCRLVDVMIVSYHGGIEYQSTPSLYYEKIYKKIADSGAMVVLSHHPHVLQKIEYYRTKDGRDALIAYSLGNFISAQARYPLSFDNKTKDSIFNSTFTKTAEGVILKFDISRWNNQYYIINAGIIPIFTVRFKYEKDKKVYTGFETIPIDYILNGKYNERVKNSINEDLIELVKYRLKKIDDLIEIEIISLE